MQTQCPSCETIFRISKADTSAASGMVQCGVCRHFFNVLADNNLQVDQPQHNQADILMDKSRSLAADNLSAALAHTIARPAASWWIISGWSALIIAALIGALAQLAWFNREQLVAQAEYKTYIEKVCEYIDCRLKPEVAVDLIEPVAHDVRSHPSLKDALLITATFVNRADFSQPYPVVMLELFDRGGKVVAQRYFQPAEYLKENNQSSTLMMESDVPVTMIMEAQDPGQASVSYHFEFM